MRTPSRFDSSRMSLTPSIRLSLAASAIFSTSAFLPCWYGISVRTIDVRSPRPFSIRWRLRTITDPRPVS